MARTVITPVKLTDFNAFSPDKTALTVAVDASAGAEFSMSGHDERTLILIQNGASAAKKVTIKAGNGIQGVCDLEKSVGASSYTVIAIDSGRFKNVSGDNKGKVIIMGESADIKVAVFELP